jgi:hypothetical protein
MGFDFVKLIAALQVDDASWRPKWIVDRFSRKV